MKKSSNEKEKHYFSHTMGCKKLAYYENEILLKVAYSNTFGEKKSMQEFLSVDPLADKFIKQSPYCAMDNNPVNKVDPTGMAAEDWFKNLTTGEIKEDKNVSGKKGEEVSLKGSSDTWKNIGKDESDPTVMAEKGNYEREEYRQTHKATGAIQSDYTFDGGAVGGIIVKNVLKPIVSPIINYFGSKMASKNGAQTVYRVFGGDARAEGFSWTPVNPTTVNNFRNVAGLPSGGASGSLNTAEFMIKGTVSPQNIISKRAALPLDGNIGGLSEYIINPQNVNKINFSVIKL